MNNDHDSQIVLALASVGIAVCERNFKENQQIIKNYVERCREKMDNHSPTFESVCLLTLYHNKVFYSFQVTLYAPREYAITNSQNYSVFKVLSKDNNNYKIEWNSNMFCVNLKQKNDVFFVEVNNFRMNEIQLVDRCTQPCVPIPLPDEDVVLGDKPNKVLDQCLSKLHNILSGFVLPEPFFTLNLNKEFETMFNVLRDPLLPTLQFQDLLEKIGSIIPNPLFNELQQVIAGYTSQHSSVLARFPSNKILNLTNRYLENIADQNTKLNMRDVLRPILELAELYSSGVRGNPRQIINDLFEKYQNVEAKFQIEDQNESTNITRRPITKSDVFSHNCLPQKNKLILCLIEYLEKYLPGLIIDLKGTINKLLNSLTGGIYFQVISKFRELLITGQTPSLEIRKNEIEAVLLGSVNRYSNSQSTCRLEKLIYSNSEMLDIISDFFYHKMDDLKKCALEVYIRRAYMAYEIQSFKQSKLPSGHLCVIFQFSRPMSNKNINVPKLKRSNSFVSLNDNLTDHGTSTKFLPFSQKPAEKLSPFYLEKDDSEPNMDFLNDILAYKMDSTKSGDNDADSAISVEGQSLSEISATVSDQVDYDSFGEINSNKCRNSPSVHSLEELPNPSRTSNVSLDSLIQQRSKRALSIFYNPQSNSHSEDFIGNIDTGIMMIFNDLEEFEKNIGSINQLLSQIESPDYCYDYFDQNQKPLSIDKIIIKVVLCDPNLNSKSDNEVSKHLSKFCSKNSDLFNDLNLISITFLLKSTDKNLRYFTFQGNNNFEEDYKLRQIDPALSFQLEIERLRNYYLERLPVINRRMYVYLGKLKSMTVTTKSEYRMFVRCIINHNEIDNSTTNVENMAREAEKSLLEAMDVLDIAWIDGRTILTSENHIYFYFHSILCISKIEELESVVRTIVLKYGRRLWSLRITQAELKLSVTLNSDHITVIPIRLWVHNEGGKSLDINIYREEFQHNLDRKILLSWSPNKIGRYHGIPVDCFYSI